ncbi:hypothetical protein HYU13_03455 [Candidatus Woesearchaeota archaeon]|nr:hypothetical protein [Candidatus Woesearchaeota archaeon]
MNTIELFVGLKIPDTTAITTLQAIHTLGKNGVAKLSREIYYKFVFEGDVDSFSQRISRADVIVNANKNSCKILKEGEKLNAAKGAVSILVRDTGDKCAGLLKTLRERLGFKELLGIERGVFWTLHFGKDAKNPEEEAMDIADELLHNRHFQEAVVYRAG